MFMSVRFVSRNIELSDDLKDYMEKKLGKLEKFFDKILDSKVALSHSRGMFVVEITSNVNGVVMRGEEYAPEQRKAFDGAIRNIETQVKKHKNFLKDRAFLKTHDLSPELATLYAAAEATIPTVTEEEIVKTKKFPLRPMSPTEATLQMDLLGHSFFVFRNAETGQTNVVYRRKEGGFGLLEPEN
jgi:putative sigma-54 modulation protein